MAVRMGVYGEAVRGCEETVGANLGGAALGLVVRMLVESEDCVCDVCL